MRGTRANSRNRLANGSAAAASGSAQLVRGSRPADHGPRLSVRQLRGAVRFRYVSGTFKTMGERPRPAGLTGKNKGGRYPQWQTGASDQLLTSAARNPSLLLNS